MTPEVVTVGEQASFKELAATMADLLLKKEYSEGPAGRRLFQGRRQRAERAKAAGAAAAELMSMHSTADSGSLTA
jgi:hypothetical protein